MPLHQYTSEKEVSRNTPAKGSKTVRTHVISKLLKSKYIISYESVPRRQEPVRLPRPSPSQAWAAPPCPPPWPRTSARSGSSASQTLGLKKSIVTFLIRLANHI